MKAETAYGRSSRGGSRGLTMAATTTRGPTDMEAHQHTMAEAVESHERNLAALYDAANGNEGAAPDDLSSLGVDEDDREESARDAITAYALDAETSITLTVTLAIGGPTQWLSATVERDDERGAWERTSHVTFHDSWAVPNKTVLGDESALVAFFDNEHVELLGE